jgi:hypothetical protein
MTSRPREDKRLRYVCRKETGGCGSVGILGDEAETWVRDVVLSALDGDGLSEAMAKLGDDRTGDLVGELTEAEARLEELSADYYGDGNLSRAEYVAAKKRVDERIGSIRTELAGQSSALAVVGNDIREWWERPGVSNDQRRAVLLAVLECVEVGPALRGRNRFDPTGSPSGGASRLVHTRVVTWVVIPPEAWDTVSR